MRSTLGTPRTTGIGRRALTLALGGLLAAGTLTACGGSETQGSATSGELNVQVYGDWPFVQRDAEAFMKLHPDAKINVGAITNDTLRSSGGRLFTSDEAPDVVSYTLQSAQMESWIKAGALQPLDDVWKQEDIASTVSDETTEQATASDGKKYSVPLGLTLLPFAFYNTDLWTAAGGTAADPATHTWTLEEFNQTLASLKQQGIIPFSSEGGWVEYMFSSPFASSCGTEKYVAIASNWEADADDSAKYTDDCVVTAIQQMADWADAGYFPEGLESVTSEQDQSLFDSQKTAAWITGSWIPPVYTPSFDWNWGLLPSLSENPSPIGTSLDSFLVPKGAKNPELAKAFIAYMVEKENLENGMGRIPARSDLAIDKVIENPLERDIYTSLTDGAPTAPAWFSLIPVSLENAFKQYVVAGAMTGSLTAEQAAEKLQAAAEEYRAQQG